jgi:predicted RNA polymerase sigma factor
MDARRAAEAVARASYGRLVAYLSARSRDVAAAEDALGDALRAALETWPTGGVPEKPEAWLLTAARRRLVDNSRHERVRGSAEDTLRLIAEEPAANPCAIPDKRLELMFVCAHSAIDPSARTPLILQTVLGLDAARIASAFLVAPKAMSQRLVRAKAKIRDAGIPFEVPEQGGFASGLEAVLEAIYAAFGAGWDDIAGADPRNARLLDEAMWLARLVVQLLPGEPEAKGLLALLLHCEARRPARRTKDGGFVPLSEQDTRLWSRSMIGEAEQLLAAAAAANRIGRFQLEAAIQSAHAERARTGQVNWEAIVQLYDGLTTIAPSIGALLGLAASIAERDDAEQGLSLIKDILPSSIAAHQPYWVLRAHLLRRMGRADEARLAYKRAIGLTEDSLVRDFLLGQLASVRSSR